MRVDEICVNERYVTRYLSERADDPLGPESDYTPVDAIAVAVPPGGKVRQVQIREPSGHVRWVPASFLRCSAAEFTQLLQTQAAVDAVRTRKIAEETEHWQALGSAIVDAIGGHSLQLQVADGAGRGADIHAERRLSIRADGMAVAALAGAVHALSGTPAPPAEELLPLTHDRNTAARAHVDRLQGTAPVIDGIFVRYDCWSGDPYWLVMHVTVVEKTALIALHDTAMS